MDEKDGWMKKNGWIKKGLMRARDALLLAAPSFFLNLSHQCSDMQGAWFHDRVIFTWHSFQEYKVLGFIASWLQNGILFH